MNYQILNEKWAAQQLAYLQWERLITGFPMIIRKKFSEYLSMPYETWTGNDEKVYRYVDIVDFYKKNKKDYIYGSVKTDSIMPDGSIIFGIGLFFDYGFDRFPKKRIYIPVALRLKDGDYGFNFYNMKDGVIDGVWTTDIDAFFLEAYQRFDAYLSHDPRSGFVVKNTENFSISEINEVDEDGRCD